MERYWKCEVCKGLLPFEPRPMQCPTCGPNTTGFVEVGSEKPFHRSGNGVWEGANLLALAVDPATATRIVTAMNEYARTRANPDGPHEIDLDGYLGSNGVRYIGKFTRQPNGKYVGMADVNGSLCRVEAVVRVLALDPAGTGG